MNVDMLQTQSTADVDTLARLTHGRACKWGFSFRCGRCAACVAAHFTVGFLQVMAVCCGATVRGDVVEC